MALDVLYAVSGKHLNKLATSESQVAAGGDLTQTLCQGRIQEFLIGGVQTLVQKGLLDSFEANHFSPTHPLPPQPLPPAAVARYNSLPAYRLLGFYL